MMFLKQSFLLALAACLGLGLVGCQPSDPNKPNVADVDSIAVTPNPVSLEIGGVQALTVTGSFSNDTSFVVTFDSRFTSSAPGVAKVDAATGYVTAVANGNATITATHTPSGKTATTTVTVAPLRVLSIAVSPAATTLAPGATQALTVNATYNNATNRPVTEGSTFVSSNPSVATVDAAGVVTAVAVGTANIRATHTASGNMAEAAITVAEVIRDFTTITFDEAGVTYTLTDFGGTVDSILVPDPTDGTNTVARVVKSAAAELWAGTTVSTGPNESVGTIPFTATATRMSVRVYSPKPNIPVRLKVEDAADPTRSVETEARTTAAINTWQTLTFDFANQVPGTAALNPAYNYNKLSIFFDFGRSGPDGGDGTYHFDDVTFVGEGGASGSTGTCVAPSCTDFSAAGIGFAPFENQGGGTVALALDPNDATNDVVGFVKKPGDGDYFGTTITGLAGPATLTDTDKVVTLRVYSPAVGTNFLFKLEGGPGGAVVEADVATTVAGAWETLSFNLSGGPAGTYATVVIFPHGRSTVTADTAMYIDELSFPTDGGGSGSGSTGTCTDSACIDFSEAGIGFAPFENQGGGSVVLALDPNDVANDVVEFVKRPGDGDYFGTVITGLGGSVVLTATSRTVTMRVYSPAVGTNFLLKFEGGTGGPATTERDAVTTTAGQWETLTFVMPDAGTYTTVVVFPHGRSGVAVDTTMYIDELRFPAFSTGGTSLTFASNYSQVDPSNWRSVEGGDAGTYIDTSVPTQYWWNGFAPNDATPSFYFGYGINTNTRPWGFGAFVRAPGNGTADVTGKANLQIAVWGNDELMNTRPTLTLILKGPTVGGCTSELAGSVSVAAPGVQNYTVALNTFTLQTPCGYASPAAALAAGVTEVHIQVLGTNVQYVTGTPPDFPNGLNVGPISFN
jgi:hypothetical protein